MKYLAILCLVPGLLMVGPCVGSAQAQNKAMNDLIAKAEAEYKRLFELPTKPHEFWAAMQFEISSGKFEFAGVFLKQLLELPAEKTDPELVKIQQAKGYGPFLDLRKVQKWSDNKAFEIECQANVRKLMTRLTEAVEKYLSDPERINKFITRLDAETPEERDYALAQLLRSRERIVPYVVEFLIREKGTQLRRRIVEAYLKLHPIAWCRCWRFSRPTTPRTPRTFRCDRPCWNCSVAAATNAVSPISGTCRNRRPIRAS